MPSVSLYSIGFGLLVSEFLKTFAIRFEIFFLRTRGMRGVVLVCFNPQGLRAYEPEAVPLKPGFQYDAGCR